MCSCDRCGKILLNKSTMAKHIINTHTNKPRQRFKCDKCSKNFITKQGLRFHEATHLGKLSFKCRICSSSLASKDSLRRHLKIHLPEPKAKLNWSSKNPRISICDKCGENFPSLKNLSKHLKQQIEMRDSVRPLSISLER